MIKTLPIQTLRTCLLGSLLALGLGACSSSTEPLGEREQPFSAGDSTGDTSEESAAACAEGVAPADAPDGFCQVTARGLCFDDGEAACACAGCASDACAIAESFPAQAFCPSDDGGSDPSTPTSSDPNAPVSSDPNVGGGTNGNPGSTSPGFPGSGTGCGNPGQIEPSAPTEPAACADGSIPETSLECDFIANGSCFDDVEAACACAGCGDDVCFVQESYPATVHCP